MALKHVLLGIGLVAAVGAGYLAYRYATGVPANTTPVQNGMAEAHAAAQETGNAISAIGPNHVEAKPTAY